MLQAFRLITREAVLILVLWLGGGLLFWAGSSALKIYKERFWTSVVVQKPAYQKLSLPERAAAHRQFMALEAARPGGQAFQKNGWGMRAAYTAQVAGGWLKGNWLMVYFVLLLGRLLWRLKKDGRDRKKPGTLEERAAAELRLVGLILITALLWYSVWALLMPSAYVYYQRLCLKSYAYLWNSRLADFDRLARVWPYILFLYPVTLAVRLWRSLTGRGRAR